MKPARRDNTIQGLVERYHATRDRALLEAILHGTTRAIRALTRTVRIDGQRLVDRDDLMVEGQFGLIQAVERYDPARPVPFWGYAKKRILGRMRDAVRLASEKIRPVYRNMIRAEAIRERFLQDRHRPASDVEVQEALGLNARQWRHLVRHTRDGAGTLLYDAIGNRDHLTFRIVELPAVGGDPVEAAQYASLVDLIRRRLSRREWSIFRLYVIDGWTERQIAALLGFTPCWISQVYLGAIRRLRRDLPRAGAA